MEQISRSLMRQPNFARLWWGQFFTIAGDRLTYLALAALLFEHSRTHAGPSYAALLALLANVMVAPVLLLAPVSGAWVDRLDPKRLIVAADVLRAILVCSMPWVYARTSSTGLIFFLVFLLFVATVIFLPAKCALVPRIVPGNRLLAANSMLAIAGVAATVIGAFVGGFVIDRWGWAVAMRMDAATYLISVGTLGFIRYEARVDRERLPGLALRRYAGEVLDGWRLVRRNADVAVGLTTLAAVWFAGGALHVAGNELLQSEASHPDMHRLGILLVAIGIGSGAGTWWMNARGRQLPRGPVLGAALALTGLALVPFAMSSSLAVFLVSAAVAAMFAAPILVLSETVLQQETALDYRARVFSARDFIVRATLLVAVSSTAWLTSQLGARVALTLCVAGVATLGAVILVRERRRSSIDSPRAIAAVLHGG